MNKESWKITPGGKAEHYWIDLFYSDEENKYGWKQIQAKSDGCFWYHQAGNVPFCNEYGFATEKRDIAACDDSIHICDIDELIKLLLELKEILRHHFEME